MSEPTDKQKQDNLRSAKVDWDASNQPISGRFQDIYFSKENGLEESRYVFLKGNQLDQRFAKLKPQDHFTVAETGFGTGLNFLSCWQHWQQHAPSEARLTFISVEKYPLLPDELTRALSLWPELSHLAQALNTEYRHQYCAGKILRSNPMLNLEFDNVRLLLIIDDAAHGLSQLQHAHFRCWRGVDAWFLDGFAPAKNPEMWSAMLFNCIGQLSHAQTSFATFTSAGVVRRGLEAIGFCIKKLSGFGHKREMLTGLYQGSPAAEINAHCSSPTLHQGETKSAVTQTPWMINLQLPIPVKTVAVIGGGLAGCHTAYALAKRGLNVSIIERDQALANGASGNPQGILYAKLSAHAQTLNDFNLFALLYAQQFYGRYWQQNNGGADKIGQDCGVLQLSFNEQLAAQHQQIAKQCRYGDFLQYLNAEEASDIAGVTLKQPALYFPLSGWIAPRYLCQWLVSAKATISQHPGIHIDKLERLAHGWRIYGSKDNKSKWQADYDAVIIANANDAQKFAQSQWLPSKAIRGQISIIPHAASPPLSALQSVVCGEGYIAPPTVIDEKIQYTLGASYALNRDDDALCNDEHQQNLAHLKGLLSLGDTPAVSGGRVSFRCTSPDYLPFVGPAPDYEAFLKDYAALQHNAKAVIPTTGSYHQQLYLNLAHGSRGLCYTPIAAEIIASNLCGEAPPLPQTILNALNPARFIIRQLSRGQRA